MRCQLTLLGLLAEIVRHWTGPIKREVNLRHMRHHVGDRFEQNVRPFLARQPPKESDPQHPVRAYCHRAAVTPCHAVRNEINTSFPVAQGQSRLPLFLRNRNEGCGGIPHAFLKKPIKPKFSTSACHEKRQRMRRVNHGNPAHAPRQTRQKPRLRTVRMNQIRPHPPHAEDQPAQTHSIGDRRDAAPHRHARHRQSARCVSRHIVQKIGIASA